MCREPLSDRGRWIWPWGSPEQAKTVLSRYPYPAIAAAETAPIETIGAGGQLDDDASTLDVLAEMVEWPGPQLVELPIEPLRHQAAGGRPV
jgi:hypothetical protein